MYQFSQNQAAIKGVEGGDPVYFGEFSRPPKPIADVYGLGHKVQCHEKYAKGRVDIARSLLVS